MGPPHIASTKTHSRCGATCHLDANPRLPHTQPHVDVQRCRLGRSPAQWVAWTQQEPVLAEVAYQDMRWQLRTADTGREDELLGALVRLVQTDPGAFGVLAACLLPALRHRVARHAPSIDRQDALAVIAAGLYEATVRYDVESHPRYVAEKQLALPTRRLRRAVTLHRRWNAHARHAGDGVSRRWS